MLHDRISDLIGTVYESAHSKELVAQTADLLLDELDGGFGLVAVADVRSESFNQVDWLTRLGSRHQDTVREYEQEMQASDPSIEFVRLNPNARFFDPTQHLGRERVDSDPYLRWYKGHFKTSQWMVAYTPVTQGFSFGISMQPRLGENFDASKQAMFRMMFEHFERARRLEARPLDLSSHDTAVILVDGAGAIAAQSVAAEAIVAARDGLVVIGDQLEPQHCHSRGAWRSLLKSAAGAVWNGGAGGVIALPRPSGKRPLIVTIDPLPEQARRVPGPKAGVLVRILDPDDGLPPAMAERWQRLFGLTPAEVRLAETFLSCDGSLREAADRLGIAYATARVQLASLCQKTDTRTQAALTRILLRTTFTSSRRPA